MLSFIVIIVVSFIASLLTFFSGFGLGTLLMPIVAIFFPIDIAIAITAIVHLANNAFKFILVKNNINFSVLIRFGLPALIMAFLGAWLLTQFSDVKQIVDYAIFGFERQTTSVNLLIGGLILLLLIIELTPTLAQLKFNKKYLPFGGVISGFFGGLSGHQGAFRSMFLLKIGLSKHAYIATGVMIAILVDFARLSVYGLHFSAMSEINWWLVSCATLSAFLGAFIGKKLLKRVTINLIQQLVSALLFSIAIALMLGFI
ncbi:MAG: TSUP family transporter [Thalassotalea sp.]